MRIKVDRRSDAYKRVIAAGFKIHNITLRRVKNPHCQLFYYIPYIAFTCVCGSTERFVGFTFYREQIPNKIDVAAMMESVGALSVEHLKEDGYTDEEIKRIRKAYDN